MWLMWVLFSSEQRVRVINDLRAEVRQQRQLIEYAGTEYQCIFRSFKFLMPRDVEVYKRLLEN